MSCLRIDRPTRGAYTTFPKMFYDAIKLSGLKNEEIAKQMGVTKRRVPQLITGDNRMDNRELAFFRNFTEKYLAS